MPTEHITKTTPALHGTETEKLSFDRLVRSLREALHGLRSRTLKKPITAPVITSGVNKPTGKKRRNDTPTGLKHSVFEDRERYPNETLANILHEKTGQQYIVADDDVKIKTRSEAIKILEFDLSDMEIETVPDEKLATMLKKRSDQPHIVVPDNHSIKAAIRSNAIEWLRKLIKRDIS